MVSDGKEEKHSNNSLQQVVIKPLQYKTKYFKSNLPSNIVCFKNFTVRGIYGVQSILSLLLTLNLIFDLEGLFYGRREARSLLSCELGTLQHSRKSYGI